MTNCKKIWETATSSDRVAGAQQDLYQTPLA